MDHSRGVSPILASVLIVLVAISLSGAFLVFTQSTATSLTESSQESQEQLQAELDARPVIEGVSDNQLFLRNTGSDPITEGDMTLFLDDVSIGHSMDASIPPRRVGTVQLKDTWRAGLGERILRISVGGSHDSVNVEVEKPEGSALDLRFDEGSGRDTVDETGNSGPITFSGSLFSDFEGELGGFNTGCGGMSTVSYTGGKIGRGVKLWSAGGDGVACMNEEIGDVGDGYTVFFYGKGYVTAQLYDGSTASYLEEVATGCRTSNSDNNIWSFCNDGNPYEEWTLFRLVAHRDPGSTSIFLYNKRNNVGEEFAGYYDFVTDGPIWAKGFDGNALYYSSRSDWSAQPHLEVQNVPALGEEYTIEGRIRRDSGGIFVSTGLPYLVADNNDAGFSYIASGTGQTNLRGGKAGEREWTHLVGKSNSTGAFFYVDGDLVDSSSLVSNSVSDLSWDVGRHVGSSGHRTDRGWIDDIRFYDTAYSPDELYIVQNS